MTKLSLIGFILALFLDVSIAQNGCIRNTTWDWRLPSSIIPSHYNLNLTLPDPNAWDPQKKNTHNFSGNVEIDLAVKADTTCVILHTHPTLTIQFPVEISFNGKKYTSNEVQYVAKSMQNAILFKDVIPSGCDARLKIFFEGEINSQDASGLFLSENKYDPPTTRLSDEDVGLMLRKWQSKKKGEKKKKKLIKRISRVNGEMMFATQFEESYARQVFPCFDEPALKTTYNASITIPKRENLRVLFNTPELSRSSRSDSVSFHFATTKNPMSSYLVAIAVGKFDFVEQKSSQGVFRIYTPPDASQYAAFALGVSVKVVDYFSKIWNFPLSNMMDKMDQISVTAIEYDAMENWGLLTYSPAFLLTDPVNATRAEQEMVALVTVHEISHQWFGDTVTCPWWTAEYLNEGFARMLQFIGVDYLFPDWYVWETKSLFLGGDNSFYGFSYNKAMGYDYKGTAPPIYVPEKDNEKQSSHIFYEKGASVNRMFLHFLGLDDWNKALSYHLNHHKWTSPNVYDLMNSFEVSGVAPKMSSYMLPWLLQSGFPVVTLSIKNNVINATQEPVSSLLKGQLWFIPLNVRAILFNIDDTPVQPPSYTQFSLNFSSSFASFKLPPPPAKKSWRIEGNYNYTGFFLANYAEEEQWAALLNRFSDPSFPIIDRQQFTEQIFYLSNSKLASVNPLLKAMHSMPQMQKEQLQKDFLKIEALLEEQI